MTMDLILSIQSECDTEKIIYFDAYNEEKEEVKNRKKGERKELEENMQEKNEEIMKNRMRKRNEDILDSKKKPRRRKTK